MPGLSRSAQVAIARLERDRFWPGATTVALRFWAAFVRSPYHRLYDPRYPGCGIWECCTPPWEARAILEAVCHVLPRRDVRIFRHRLMALDDLW